jgi:hypothetical protein
MKRMRSSLVLLSLLGLTLSVHADDAAMSANVQPVAAKKSLASRLKSKLGLNVGNDIQAPKVSYQYLSDDLVHAIETAKVDEAMRKYDEELAATPSSEQAGLKNEFGRAWAKRIQLKQAQAAAKAEKGKADMTASAIAAGAGVVTTAVGGAVVAEGAVRKGISAYRGAQAKSQVEKEAWEARKEYRASKNKDTSTLNITPRQEELFAKYKAYEQKEDESYGFVKPAVFAKNVNDQQAAAINQAKASVNTKYRTGTMIGGGALAAGGALITAGGAAGIAHAASELKTADTILKEAREEIAAAQSRGLFDSSAAQVAAADTRAAEALLDDAKQAVAENLDQIAQAAPVTKAPAQTTVTVSTPTKTTVVSTKTAPKGKAAARSTARASVKGKAARTQGR